MIGHGFLELVLYLVGYLTGIDQFFYQRLDGSSALSNLLDKLEVAGVQLLGFHLWEHVGHALHVLQELTLIAGSHGDDVVHGEVAQYTGFYLYLLGVGLPLHFIPGFQFLLSHNAQTLEHLDAVFV